MKYQVEIKKLPKSTVELKVSLPANFLLSAKDKALKNLSLNLEIDGFRKGHAPADIVIRHLGESRILEESANIALNEHFPKIIEEHGLDVLGHPHISITKLAFGNNMEFSAIVSVMPEFSLPKYKEIAKKIRDSKREILEKVETASEKEIDEVLLQIRKNKAHLDYHKNNPEAKGHDHPDLDKEKNLPPLDDELAKQAGNFKDIAELKERISQNIADEKKYKNIEKVRAEIIEELVKKTDIEVPAILTETEVNKSIARMKDDLARMGGKWEDYLSHIKKDEAALRKELEQNSEKKVKIQLIFNKIAEVEKFVPNKDILEHEVKEILRLYPDSSPENARTYVSTIILNQEVLKLLERD